MNDPSASISRRAFLATGGALIVSFSLSSSMAAAARPKPPTAGKGPPALPLPGDLERAPMLDSWIRISADGTITVFTGKAELGQGVKTALIQVAPEELDVNPARIHLVTADTARTPDEGYTAGSQSMSGSGTALLNAAAQVRGILLALAAKHFGTRDPLTVHDGMVQAPDGHSVTYGELVRDEELHVTAQPRSPMVTSVKARLEDGRIAAWDHQVWSHAHSTRPGPAGNLAPAWSLDPPFVQPVPTRIPLPNGGGDRNAIPLYRVPNARVTLHFVPSMTLRVSALRSLGAYMNVFSIESFMDELAAVAHADPVDFRLRHLDDPRAKDVVRLAAERFGWSHYERQRDRGRGFGFARYKNHAAYAAIACEVAVQRETGHVRVLRTVAACDSGEAVNPDGIRNQVEDGIVQSVSWTLYEEVGFDTMRITSRDWGSYPILRFSEVPDSIEVHIIDRPGEPFLGTGEAAQGPAAAAIANAVADATGARMRELPLTPRRVKAAVGT